MDLVVFREENCRPLLLSPTLRCDPFRKRLCCYFPQNIFVTALHRAKSTSLVTVGGTLVRFMMGRYPQAVGMKCEAYNGDMDCVLGCLFLF